MGMRMPVRIIGLDHALGSAVSTNASMEERFGLAPGFIMEKTGIAGRRYFAPGENPRGLAVRLARGLLAKFGIEDAVPVFGSANPYGEYAIPAPTMEVAHELGFRNVPVFHVNYGCGGYLGAIQAIHDHLQTRADTTVLLILTDWPSSMVDRYETAVLFSDAVHVSLWSNSPRYAGIEVKEVFYENSLENPYALTVQGGTWQMDGSAIARFARTVPGIIAERMSIDLKDFEIVPHQPSAKLLETLERDYGVPFYREDAERFGNATCSAMMIALQNRMAQGISYKPLLLMGFGDTESYGAVVTEKIPASPVR